MLSAERRLDSALDRGGLLSASAVTSSLAPGGGLVGLTCTPSGIASDLPNLHTPFTDQTSMY